MCNPLPVRLFRSVDIVFPGMYFGRKRIKNIMSVECFISNTPLQGRFILYIVSWILQEGM